MKTIFTKRTVSLHFKPLCETTIESELYLYNFKVMPVIVNNLKLCIHRLFQIDLISFKPGYRKTLNCKDPNTNAALF